MPREDPSKRAFRCAIVPGAFALLLSQTVHGSFPTCLSVLAGFLQARVEHVHGCVVPDIMEVHRIPISLKQGKVCQCAESEPFPG